MKKSIGVLFIFLFLVSSVYAACSNDQTIVRLYRENNSHVSAWDDTNYPIQICYNDLFGYNYTGSNPHNCTVANANAVFWVNSTKNSHISSGNSSEFNNPICYGNLDCSFKTACDPDNEVLLLRAYDVENSHVSLVQTDYHQVICCKNSLAISSSFWSDLNGKEITHASLGDTVLMVAKGFKFEGQNLSYILVGNSETTNIGTKIWNWVTFRGWDTPDRWMQVSTNEWKTDKVGTFRFTVNVVGTDITASSFSKLNVSTPEFNTKPFVNITSAKVVNTLVNTPVSFNSTVYDKEDFLTVVWDYADGTHDMKEHYFLATEDKQYLNATHSFSKPGHYVIKLTATEESVSRGQTSSDSVDVYVFDEGINVIPIVSSPINGKTDYGNLIRFDASSSYVVNCSFSVFNTSYDKKINDTELNCKYIHAPNQPTIGGNYSLDISWLIDQRIEEQGAWGSVVSTGTIQNFLKYFITGKAHIAQLSLTYTPN